MRNPHLNPHNEAHLWLDEGVPTLIWPYVIMLWLCWYKVSSVCQFVSGQIGTQMTSSFTRHRVDPCCDFHQTKCMYLKV